MAFIPFSSGTIFMFAGETAPSGWLICDGTAISRSTYADLFLAIGTVHGTGDGSTTFNLPDLRGEFIRGLDKGRGVDSSRTFGSSQGSQQSAHTHDLGTTAMCLENVPHNHPGSSGNVTAGTHTHPAGNTSAANAPHCHTMRYTWPLAPAGPASNVHCPTIAQRQAPNLISNATVPHSHTAAPNGTVNISHSHPVTINAANAPHTHAIAGSTGSQGGTENSSEVRPRNVAMNYIIKI